MSKDLTLKKDILDELEFEPSIDAENIGVTVDDGIARLTGRVPLMYQKSKAEEAVWRVFGVKGVVQNIEVTPGHSAVLDDEEIAHRVLEHLRWRVLIPEESVQIKVQDGWVVLRGDVEWNYQRWAAVDVVNGIDGVQGMINEIRVVPCATENDVKQHIEKALQRRANIDADRIVVDVLNGTVTLAGTVHSWQERTAIKQAAWSARGVSEVVDELAVG